MAAFAVATVSVSCTSLPAPIESAQPLPVDGTVTVESEWWVTDRLVELHLLSPAVGHTAARILLPEGYREQPQRTWPVLSLLHGGGGDFRDWSTSTNLPDLIGDRGVIVVMPDGGPGATYLNWVFDSPTGRPQWETFHLVELRNLLRDRFRANDRLAVAGLSAGAFGAVSYAARHPDLFAATASFSGNLDTRDDDVVGPFLSAAVTYALERTTPLGDPYTHEARWRGHNPLDLAPNLRDVAVFVSGGTGDYGELDPPLTLPDYLTLESSTYRRSRTFVARMTALGLGVTTDLYGNGTHSFRYWGRELGRALPMLLAALERDRPAPDSFTFRSVDDRFDVWGWRFEVSGRSALAFTDVSVAPGQVEATGDGVLSATTPPQFAPGVAYEVGGERVEADEHGRLRFTMDLGDTAEDYSTGPDLPGPRPTGPPAVVDLVPLNP